MYEYTSSYDCFSDVKGPFTGVTSFETGDISISVFSSSLVYSYASNYVDGVHALFGSDNADEDQAGANTYGLFTSTESDATISVVINGTVKGTATLASTYTFNNNTVYYYYTTTPSDTIGIYNYEYWVSYNVPYNYPAQSSSTTYSSTEVGQLAWMQEYGTITIASTTLGGNPYDSGGTSSSGGGSGTFSLDSDAIDFPDLPSLNIIDAGLVSIFAPTKVEMLTLADYLWSDVFSIDSYKKIIADPFDILLGGGIYPFNVATGEEDELEIGGISTGITMTRAAAQYYEVDCGSLTVSEYWGAYLDYSPYTKFSIYLPYIGTRELKADDIMTKTLQVKYHIDILSGACTAMIKAGDAVLYQYTGSCVINIPFSSTDYTSFISSVVQLAAAGLSVATTAGGGALAGSGLSTGASGITSGVGLGQSAAHTVMSLKPTIQRAGSVSGAGGMLGVQTPYLIQELPRQSNPTNQQYYKGLPCNMTLSLDTIEGFTVVELFHFSTIGQATEPEQREINNLLKSGVIF